jgi:4-amino-4-deoxy-L-arabinose transferase-like glycosyltransferase
MTEVARWKVLQAWAGTVLVAVAARYGIHLTDEQAAAITLVVGSALMKWAHNRTTPTDSPRVTKTEPLIPLSQAGDAAAGATTTVPPAG